MSKLKSHIYISRLTKFAMVAVALTFAICALRLNTVIAQDALPLHITPVRNEVRLNPGESTSFTITVSNSGKEEVSGTLKIYDFLVQDKHGKPTIYENPTPLSTRMSARTWLRSDVSSLTIHPNEKITSTITVSSPSNALPGERYAAIFFEPSNYTDGANRINNGTNVSIVGRIGSIVNVRINGEASESALITKLEAPWFSEHGPVTVVSEVLNRSGYSISPQGAIELTDTFGRKGELSKLESHAIFPDASREYVNKLGTKWMFGRYSITMNIAYGERGQTAARSVIIWILPWKVIITVALSLLILYFLIKSYIKANRNNSYLENDGLRDSIVKKQKQGRE